ncbi:MAG: FHA domain-containing protein [Ruminococcus sp.]|nr:FHA domain-containing protein [Ruminococcus sp.]
MIGSVKTKILYQNCDTYFQINLKKKDQIYENHLQFLNNNHDSGFLRVRWEKTATRNVLKYDVSNLIALSEYIKQNMTQEKYFSIIGQFQKILECCSVHNLNVNNLILADTKSVYYNVETKSLFVAYLPLVENNYSCSNVVKFLYKLNKSVNISVSNGNVMNKYELFLEEHLKVQKTKKDKNSCFSHNHLYNFLHDNYSVFQELNDVPDMTVKHVKAETPQNMCVQDSAYVPPFQKNEQESDHTILVSAKKNTDCKACITDDNGRVFPLDHFPFTIGRKAGNDLPITNSGTVSGIHAAVTYENGCYYIEDKYSSNGTFLNETPDSGKKIVREQLTSGDTIYIYNVPLKFTVNSGNSGTVVVGAKKAAKAEVPTMSESKKEEKPQSQDNIAYLMNSSSKQRIPVYSYPFTCAELPGIIIGQDNSGSRHSIFIENIGCQSFVLEGSEAGIGTKNTIFSGCKFLFHGIQYTFFEEN